MSGHIRQLDQRTYGEVLETAISNAENLLLNGISTVWERFAIRHTPTGRYLPERWRKGRGYSYDKPSHGFPRLFPSERSAKQALTAWLQGEWKEESRFSYSYASDGYEAYGPEPTEVKGRLRSEMEIVRMRVTCGEAI